MNGLVKGLELAERFRTLESHISEERGAFVLFALFLREEAPICWDLLVAAPWIGDDRRAAVDYFVSQIKSRLGNQDLIALCKIVVLDPAHAEVQALTREIQVEHGRIEVRDTDIFGQTIRRGYFITSKQAAAPAAA
jgi:hypothetical protein